jgi:hypothetical protein
MHISQKIFFSQLTINGPQHFQWPMNHDGTTVEELQASATRLGCPAGAPGILILTYY